MKKLLIAAAVTVLGMASAHAADMAAQTYVKARPIDVVSSWSGFYAGVNAGGLFETSGTWRNAAAVTSLTNAANDGNTTAALQASTSSFILNVSGFWVGIQSGYNFQVAPLY